MAAPESTYSSNTKNYIDLESSSPTAVPVPTFYSTYYNLSDQMRPPHHAYSSSSSRKRSYDDDEAYDPSAVTADYAKRAKLPTGYVSTASKDAEHFVTSSAHYSRESSSSKHSNEQEITVKGAEMKKITSFQEIDLPDTLLKGLKAENWLHPTPIQSVSIPIALSGRDLVGIAQTGSGKSLAFVLPAVSHLLNKRSSSRSERGPYVLILTPTRELAIQLNETATAVCRYAPYVKSALAYGGVPKSSQAIPLRRGVDIVIATPGRLIDFMENKTVSLDNISYLVLDEADRMLDMGFEPQIRKIISNLPTKRQTLMYSATWPTEVQNLAKDFFYNPVQISVGQVSQSATANMDITQRIMVSDKYDKMPKLLALLPSLAKQGSGLIFVQLKKNTDWLEKELSRYGYPVIGLHGDKPQYVREKNLAQFNSGYKPILIATDVASRGLDFKDVKWVVNFEFPQTIEDYVHRIGRTGRAGREGSAYSFITEDEKRLAKPLVDLLRAAGQPVDQSLIDMAARATIAMHAKNAAKYSKYRANRYGSSSSSSYSSYSNNNGNRSTNHWQGRPSGSGYSNASSSSTSFSSQSTSSSGSYNNNWNYSSSSHR